MFLKMEKKLLQHLIATQLPFPTPTTTAFYTWHSTNPLRPCTQIRHPHYATLGLCLLSWAEAVPSPTSSAFPLPITEFSEGQPLNI